MPKGKELIDRICNQMNNNRLYTSIKPQINRTALLANMTNILSMPSNFDSGAGAIHLQMDTKMDVFGLYLSVDI